MSWAGHPGSGNDSSPCGHVLQEFGQESLCHLRSNRVRVDFARCHRSTPSPTARDLWPKRHTAMPPAVWHVEIVLRADSSLFVASTAAPPLIVTAPDCENGLEPPVESG